MEGKKNTGLVTILAILMLIFAAGSVLLFTGVIKSPMVKCEDTKEEKADTKTTDDTKKDEKKEEEKTVKETRYYQLFSKISEDGTIVYNPTDSSDSTLIDYKSGEIILYADGTYESYGCGAASGSYYKGQYVEDDKFIVLIGNVPNCRADVPGSCTETYHFIKNNEKDELMSGVNYDSETKISTNLFEFDNTKENVYKRVEQSSLKCSQ